MSGHASQGSRWYRTYVVTWVWLLLITALEIGIVVVGVTRGLLISLLLILSLMKAALIVAYFMHLRYERLNLAFAMLLPLVILAVVLFAGVAPDGLNAFHLRR